MAIAVKLICSECSTTREALLNTDEKEISCPSCGRRINNLTANEHTEISDVQSRQRMMTIIAFVLLVLSAVSCVMWVGGATTWKSDIAQPKADMTFLIGFLVTGIAAMVTGAMGSSKRFIVEF